MWGNCGHMRCHHHQSKIFLVAMMAFEPKCVCGRFTVIWYGFDSGVFIISLKYIGCTMVDGHACKVCSNKNASYSQPVRFKIKLYISNCPCHLWIRCKRVNNYIKTRRSGKSHGFPIGTLEDHQFIEKQNFELLFTFSVPAFYLAI